MNTNSYKIPYSGPAYSAWGEPLEEYGIARVENIEAAHDIIVTLLDACKAALELIPLIEQGMGGAHPERFRRERLIHGAIAKAQYKEAQP